MQPSSSQSRALSHATPLPHGPSTSWSDVFKQIKSLVCQSPFTTAAVVGLGVGAIAWTLVASDAARRRARARRVAMRLVKAQFDTCRLDILKYLWESHENSFSVAELEKIYAAFSALLPNKKRGVLPISTLTQIIRETGVDDEKVALACAQFFDLNNDAQVNFLELVERLHLVCFGTKAALLESLFSVFDLDASRQISRDEMETVMAALQHSRTKEQRHTSVQNLFRKADSNHDGLISLKGQTQTAARCSADTPVVSPSFSSHSICLSLCACVSVCCCARPPLEFLSLAEDDSLQFNFLPGLRRHFGLEQ